MNKKGMTLGNRSRGDTLSQLIVRGDVVVIMINDFEQRNTDRSWKAG